MVEQRAERVPEPLDVGEQNRLLVAAKLGGPDPDLNARLYAAIEAARKASVPRDTIDRAIKKGSGQTGEKVNYELVTYEGFISPTEPPP